MGPQSFSLTPPLRNPHPSLTPGPPPLSQPLQKLRPLTTKRGWRWPPLPTLDDRRCKCAFPPAGGRSCPAIQCWARAPLRPEFPCRFPASPQLPASFLGGVREGASAPVSQCALAGVVGDAVPSIGSGKPGSRPGMMLFGLPGCSNNTPAALPLRPERPGPPRYSSGPFTPGAPPPRGRVTARAEQSGGSTRRASRLLHRNNTRTWGHSPGTRRCRRGGRGAGETAPLPPHPRWCRRVQLPPPPGPAGGAAPPFPARPGTRGDLWFFLRGGLPKAFRNPAGK